MGGASRVQSETQGGLRGRNQGGPRGVDGRGRDQTKAAPTPHPSKSAAAGSGRLGGRAALAPPSTGRRVGRAPHRAPRSGPRAAAWDPDSPPAPVCRHPGGGPPPERSRVPPPTGSRGLPELWPQRGAPTLAARRRPRHEVQAGSQAHCCGDRRGHTKAAASAGTKTWPRLPRGPPPCPTLRVTLGASLHPPSLSFPDYTTNRAQQAAGRPSSRDPGRGLPTSVDPAGPGSCNHADGGAGGRGGSRSRGRPGVGAEAAPGPRLQGFCRPRGRPSPVPTRPWPAAPSPRGLAVPGLLWAGRRPADALELGSTFGRGCGEALQPDATTSTATHFRSGGLGSAPWRFYWLPPALLPRFTGRGGIFSMLWEEITVYYRFEMRLPAPLSLASSSSLLLARDTRPAPLARPQGLSGVVVCGGRTAGSGTVGHAALNALVPDLTRPSPGLRFLPYWRGLCELCSRGKVGLDPQPLQGALGRSLPVALTLSSTARPTCGNPEEGLHPDLGSARKRRPFFLCRLGLLSVETAPGPGVP